MIKMFVRRNIIILVKISQNLRNNTWICFINPRQNKTYSLEIPEVVDFRLGS